MVADGWSVGTQVRGCCSILRGRCRRRFDILVETPCARAFPIALLGVRRNSPSSDDPRLEMSESGNDFDGKLEFWSHLRSDIGA